MTISGDVLVHRIAGILNEQGKPPHDSTILGAISKLSWYEMEHICEFDRASKSAESPGTVPPVGAANNARLEIAEKLLTQWHKYWNHTADLTTAEAVDLQNATYSFIKSSATSPVA